MRADDLLILLEVFRSGTFIQAGIELGLDHTTISRRISALESTLGSRVVDRSSRGIELTSLGKSLIPAAEQIEQALDGAMRIAKPDSELAGQLRIAAPEGFGIRFIAPVMARMHRRHRLVTMELVTATRPFGHSTGVDIEIGVGAPESKHHEVISISTYALGLYATPEYLQQFGTPASPSDLAQHSMVYYIDSLQRVSDLDLEQLGLPRDAVQVSSTNVFAHLEATRAGAGIGLLPAFIAATAANLVQVLPNEIRLERPYFALIGAQVLRRPATAAFMAELHREVRTRQDELLGRHYPAKDEPPNARGNIG